jgi:hypothetical protein
MKLFPLVVLMGLTLAVPHGAYAKKGKGKEEHAPQPTPIPMPSAANPVGALSPYIVNLEQLLSLDRAPATASQPLFTQTSGLLITLRQQFVSDASSAPAEKKNLYTAAINTVDLINAALDDRTKALGNLHSSQAVGASGTLEQQSRKDNLAQGIHGGGIGKAEAVAVERNREKQEIKRADGRAGASGNAMTSMAMNQWTQRATDWRQRIAASYGQVK